MAIHMQEILRMPHPLRDQAFDAGGPCPRSTTPSRSPRAHRLLALASELLGLARLPVDVAYGAKNIYRRLQPRTSMTDPLPLPKGFRVGHWTDARAQTGCTVVIPPPGTRGGVDVRGGGTGTRELELLSPLANAEGPTAVLLTGGSAFGLAAADGVARWLEERGLGQPTPAGVVPLVPAAVVFDLVEGASGTRPGPRRAT